MGDLVLDILMFPRVNRIFYSLGVWEAMTLPLAPISCATLWGVITFPQAWCAGQPAGLKQIPFKV